MTTTTAHKRLDAIEAYLTPTEWAVRLADEARNYSGGLAYTKALAKLPWDELPVRRQYFALEEQAGERHRAKRKLWHATAWPNRAARRTRSSAPKGVAFARKRG